MARKIARRMAKMTKTQKIKKYSTLLSIEKRVVETIRLDKIMFYEKKKIKTKQKNFAPSSLQLYSFVVYCVYTHHINFSLGFN